jgi:hypothetical protein
VVAVLIDKALPFEARYDVARFSWHSAMSICLSPQVY